MVEEEKMVAYDQKEDFQRLIFINYARFTSSQMSFNDNSHLFAFINKKNREINLLTFEQSFNNFNLHPFIKHGISKVALSNENNILACLRDDFRRIKIYNVNSTKEAMYQFSLNGREVSEFWVITEKIFLFYYSDNSFSLIDFDKIKTNYFLFTSYFEISFKPNYMLCLYELNKHTKPIVFFDIDYYDRKNRSIRGIEFVS